MDVDSGIGGFLNEIDAGCLAVSAGDTVGLANEMIDRVGLFMEKYEAVGKALKKASDEYEDGKKKLVPQGQSIINTSGKLIKLGAKNSDRHPIKTLLDVDEIPALPEGVVGTEVRKGTPSRT